MPYWAVLLFDCGVVLCSHFLLYTMDHGIRATWASLGAVLVTLIIYLIPYVVGFRLFHT